MRIFISKETLKRHRACRDAYVSPEWDEKEGGIVFTDWDRTVKRFLAEGQRGIEKLDWYVAHKLVPMTPAELDAIKKREGAK